MRLSEAIRLGDTLIRNDQDAFFSQDEDTHQCMGCAIGSALYAIGIRIEDFPSDTNANHPGILMQRLLPHFPILAMPIKHTPFSYAGFEYDEYFDRWNLFCEISTMHRKDPDRERIADFVAKLENEHPEYLCPSQPETESNSSDKKSTANAATVSSL